MYDAIKRYKELGNASVRPRSGKPRTARTQKLKNAFKACVARNPTRSMRKMAREMDMSEPTMKRIVITELKLSHLKI